MVTRNSPQAATTKCEITLSHGLIDQDDNLDFLTTLFEKLQLATVEAADPGIDIITFAHSAHYFAVILAKEPVQASSTTSSSSLSDSATNRGDHWQSSAAVLQPPLGDQTSSRSAPRARPRRQRRKHRQKDQHQLMEDTVCIIFFSCALLCT